MNSIKLEVELRIDLKDRDLCNACVSALRVDDYQLPQGIEIIERGCEGTVLKYRFRVHLDEEHVDRVLKLWSAVDDIIRCLRAAVESLTSCGNE